VQQRLIASPCPFFAVSPPTGALPALCCTHTPPRACSSSPLLSRHSTTATTVLAGNPTSRRHHSQSIAEAAAVAVPYNSTIAEAPTSCHRPTDAASPRHQSRPLAVRTRLLAAVHDGDHRNPTTGQPRRASTHDDDERRASGPPDPRATVEDLSARQLTLRCRPWILVRASIDSCSGCAAPSWTQEGNRPTHPLHPARFELVIGSICMWWRFSDFGAGTFAMMFGRREQRHFIPRRVGPKSGTDLHTPSTRPDRRFVA
jgi:hypothetical protein